MVKDTTEHKWVEWAEDSFHSAGFGRDSRASFAAYGEGWCHSFLCLHQVTTFLAYTRSKDGFLLIPGHQIFSCLYKVIRGYLAYTRSSEDFLLIPGEARYSHQWPGCGGRFLGRYNAEERFLGRLREWRLGERDPRPWDGSGQRLVSSRPASVMSKTVGGRSARLTAAASGGAASSSSLVSGQAARGWGSTRPGLNPPAILSYPFGSVNDTFLLGCPGGDPGKESR